MSCSSEVQRRLSTCVSRPVPHLWSSVATVHDAQGLHTCTTLLRPLPWVGCVRLGEVGVQGAGGGAPNPEEDTWCQLRAREVAKGAGRRLQAVLAPMLGPRGGRRWGSTGGVWGCGW